MKNGMDSGLAINSCFIWEVKFFDQGIDEFGFEEEAGTEEMGENRC